jgi:CRISPR type III-A-associated RAMP protein Csm4
MQTAVLIRLRPMGPWRYGPGEGGQDRVDTLYRSDRLYSAISLAMRQLGSMDEWLEATARASTPAVTFSSLFPYQGETLFAPPPATAWPPPPALVTTPSPVFLSKIRWNAARFVPVSVIESILAGQPILADQWMLDAESGCLVRRDRPSVSPFREVIRRSAAVDRVGGGAVNVHSVACVEFEAASGLWCLVRYADSEAESAWSDRLQACFRLLADTGFGGRRTSGFGQTEAPQFQHGTWPQLLMPKLARLSREISLKNGQAGNGDAPSLYWLLSLYSPAAQDPIDWSGGDYRLMTRGGRVENGVALGLQKKTVQMVAEGSVLATRAEPVGTAVDVAPGGVGHPVYRSGFAIALRLPAVTIGDLRIVETPSGEETIEPRPCEEAPREEAEIPAVEEEPASIGEPADEL